jgi:hypothetical protein
MVSEGDIPFRVNHILKKGGRFHWIHLNYLPMNPWIFMKLSI